MMGQIALKFKKGQRVWAKSYDCFGEVLDVDIMGLLSSPQTEYHVQLEEYRGVYITSDVHLQTEEERNGAARN